MKFFVIVLSIVFSTIVHAGDIIGNGGSVWSCGPLESPEKIMLVDFFEAEAEMQWTLNQYSHEGDYRGIVSALLSDLKREFPQRSTPWLKEIQHVLNVMKIADVELVVIDDAHYRSRPKNSDCFNGKWQVLQLANYTHLNVLLVQKGLWENPLLSELEKAGLVVHEAIYKWMREKYKDENSIRARYITGLLFSKVAIAEKVKLISDLLGDPPKREVNGWLCAWADMMSLKFFTGFGETEGLASKRAEASCLQEGGSVHCAKVPMLPCDRVTSMENKWVCHQRNGVSDLIFEAKGRGPLEALVNVQNMCVDEDPNLGFHCENPECERIK